MKTPTRGDTFFVRDDKLRGNHFTCVGKSHNGFYAGDTNGRMWHFREITGVRYKVDKSQGPTNRYYTTINAEAIIQE